jgi:signal peptidase I
LITDYYAYNDFLQLDNAPRSVYAQSMDRGAANETEEMARRMQVYNSGMNWVGDLALECDVRVSSHEGALLLDLVEAGVHFTCRIDTATGEAQLSIDGPAQFSPVNGKSPQRLVAQTNVKGAGTYRFRFANVDDQLLLWVGRKPVSWQVDGEDHPAHTINNQSRPSWSADDAGDLAPLGIGGEGIEMTVTNLRVLRDIYYVAAKSTFGHQTNIASDYENGLKRFTPQDVVRVFKDPSVWATTDLFDLRQTQQFELKKFPNHPGDDQFFPMGDNNPQSKDARLWTSGNEPSVFSGKHVEIDHYVERDLLIGKAFLVYWPHGWNVANMRLPIVPNLRRMGRIR